MGLVGAGLVLSKPYPKIAKPTKTCPSPMLGFLKKLKPSNFGFLQGQVGYPCLRAGLTGLAISHDQMLALHGFDY